MTYVDRAGRPIDVFGRPELHRPLVSLLDAAPGLRDQFKPVPAGQGFYERLSPSCLVFCPCESGSVLVVPRGAMRSCQGCGRVYVWTGKGLAAAQGMTDAEWQAFQAEPLEAA